MAYYTPYEEQTQCDHNDECDNIATEAVLVGSCFHHVCKEHKEAHEEWIAESLT